MPDDFGLRIGIEGEREFKSALKDINQQFKVLGSEMKLVESQFDKQDRSVSALTSRNEVLTRQINEQKEKIELLRRALENSAESFGENDQRTKQWTVQLNNAQAQLNNMERELKDNEKAIDGVGDEFQSAEKKADGFGDEVKEAANKADDASDRFRKLGDTLKTIGRALAIGLVAIGTAAIAAGTSLVGMTVDAAAYADDMLTQSSITGISVEKLQAYSYAADLVDVSLETMTGSMAKNIKSMSNASQGSAKFAEAYQKLGVSVNNADGTLRDSETVYWEAIDALGKVSNETERDALAMQLFGKSAQDLNPLIAQGSEGIAALTEEAKRMGAVLSEESIEKLGQFDDSVQRLKPNYVDSGEQQLIEVSGRGVLAMLNWAVVYPEDMGVPVLDRPFSGTASKVLRTLILEAQARGGLVGVSVDWEDDQDSLGNSFTENINLSFHVGTPLLEVATKFTDGLGYFDIEMTPELVLKIYKTKGEDLHETVIYRPGQAMISHQNQIDAKSLVNEVLVEGGDKLLAVASHSASQAVYTKLITAREDWEYVDVYTDEGISALNTKHRDGFKQMIQDALDGKIDLIVTKSVSRFARNTVDSLVTIRKLKEKGVECYFEKENIFTFDGKGELLLTIMSSLAQEESRSISENVTWGQRKRFSDGKVSVGYSQFLGFEKGEDGSLKVVPEQAETVRLIYKLFLEGKTTQGIANFLMEHGILSPAGKQTWPASTIASILTNEKYKGDALLQKRFTANFLTKELRINNGEVPQYYVEGSHEAIIAPEEFQTVQEEMARRKELGRAYSDKAFHSKIICGDCGGFYGRKVWHSTDEYKSVIFQCNRKFKNEYRCRTPKLTEDEIKGRFLAAYNELMGNRNAVIADCELIRQTLCDTTRLDSEMQREQDEMTVASELMKTHVKKNASVAQSQEIYAQEAERIEERYNSALEHHTALESEREKRIRKSKELTSFIAMLKKQPLAISEWDERIWITLLDTATVQRDGRIVFQFKSGKKIYSC